MDNRKDALVAAARFITMFDEQIRALGPDVTGMVGKLDITPNSNQFVPELVEGKIEIRTFSKECIEKDGFQTYDSGASGPGCKAVWHYL